MSRETVQFMPHPDTWTRRDLLDLESLTLDELTTILDTAFAFKKATEGCRRKLPLLEGKTTSNLFFENSTRTRTSFGLAAKRLGADVVDFTASSSSLSKGETFIDTAKNIEAMNVDVMVMRHRTPGTPQAVGRARRLPGDQCGGRDARASHAGAVGHHDDPGNAGGRARTDRGPGG